jgi:hypothetical protein
MHGQGSAFGVVGVFLTLLGAGVILDADWIGIGSVVMAAGVACLTTEARRPFRGETSP